MSKAWDEAVATPCEFFVKNTFIDVQQDCHEINWQRQVSEPAKMWQRQFSEGQILSECQMAWEHPAQSVTQETLPEPEGEPLRRVCTPPDQETPTTREQDGSTGGSGASAQGTIAWAASAPSSVAGEQQDEEHPVRSPPPPPPPEWESMHTVMMRNLPNKYTQHMLMSEISQDGFHGRFDFLYLPIDPETGANRGYAFLNFDDPAWAWLFKTTFEGRKMSHFNSGKVVGVHAAALQGFEANHAHYSASRVNRGDLSMRPIFFREPSGEESGAAPAGRKGRRRRKGGTSAIDLAARRQQQEQLEQRQQQEEQRQTPTLESLPEPEALATTEEAEATPMPTESAVTPAALAAAAAAPVAAALMEAAPSPRARTRLAAPEHSKTWLESNKAKFCDYCDGKAQPHHRFCHFCGSTLVTCMSRPPPAEVDPRFGFAQVSACNGGDEEALPLCYILVPRPAPAEPSWTTS